MLKSIWIAMLASLMDNIAVASPLRRLFDLNIIYVIQ
jgi:hypothetical protein